MAQKAQPVLVAVATVSLIAGLLWIAVARTAGQQPELVAVKVTTPPVIDGAVDAVWNQAKPITIRVTGGANQGSHDVVLRAIYTTDSVYFLAQWNDQTESLRRFPWEKQADGSWKQLKTSTEHDENTYYEDKFAVMWNNNISGFEQSGCFATCHAGEKPAGSAYGNKYTPNPGEWGDIWHWKAVRTNPVGYIDDQYVDSARYDKDKAPEAGRHSDPKTGGGYTDNKTADGKLPAFALPGNKPAPPFWILDAEKTPFDNSKYKAGDQVPGIIVAPFAGDRGDIRAKGVYANGQWSLEWGRKLTTPGEKDVQFKDLSKAYAFGIAVFDNAQVRHSFQMGVARMVFQR
ncbi:MAG: ethylbenzene dehydrogenase-related protein [Armatimonadota bacterium]|nr:ethylbenzene dehydrogenase-related protein [Armatimonadota bacterium]MDR7463670.1 ethylbenzene dehydrogenase-related protein [Armatimonadota bacterium]MDR7468591.1 ethylbenzene dehydrogenase-related protein [Armatimonadota bacterium]MDR7475989.1 ethylbenzene dehydrogenase-related protein [Armatimonadota bacterium]MDR7538097.1 ethylbenzene dehydrogenase-related protein [Armatimonadota bacterium]